MARTSTRRPNFGTLALRSCSSWSSMGAEVTAALFQQGANAVFPGGTLLMRRRFGVPCDPLDATCWCQLAVT